MKNQLVVCAFILLFSLGYKQGESQSFDSLLVQPLFLDPTVLSGVGLTKLDLPNEPERAFFQKNLFRGEDLSVYIVSSQSWPGKMENFAIDEYVYILNGKSRAKPINGQELFFYSGEHFTIPKGYTGDWEVIAGDNYHYELSVITTKRASEAKLSKELKPQLLNKNSLSGVNIEFNKAGVYEEEVFRGDELQILLLAERPRRTTINAPMEEQVIRILSGQLELTDRSGAITYFSTGDYLILPKGFIGEWKSNGHGMLKYLSIKKTETL